MHDYPRFNKVQIQDGKVISFCHKNDAVQKLAFTGIQVIDPAILQNIPTGVFANIIDYYERFLLNGGQIKTITINDFWHDIGTPADYLALHSYLLNKRSPDDNWQPLNTMGFYKFKDVKMGHNTSCLDWGIIGSGATVGNNVSLERVVVWDGANVLDNTTAKDQIIT
jgi:mannose-1-phosphate guanylyltransferase